MQPAGAGTCRCMSDGEVDRSIDVAAARGGGRDGACVRVAAAGDVHCHDGNRLPDFGEPRLRALYAETASDVEALDHGLREIAHCPVRIVLLHYAPIAETLEGEPPEIWAMLGTDRLAGPLVEHQPQLVLHGHAHAGRFAGSLGAIPVHNVSVPVMQRDFWIFELAGVDRA